jgi:hypothetical protein
MTADRVSRGSEPVSLPPYLAAHGLIPRRGQKNTSISNSHLSPFSNAKRSQVTYRVRGIPREYNAKRVQELLSSILELDGTRGAVQIRSIAISLNQKTKIATVDFKNPPAWFSLDRNEWSFEIPDVDSSDAKNDDTDDDDDIIPKAPTITIDTHFKGITMLRSFKNISEHKIE